MVTVRRPLNRIDAVLTKLHARSLQALLLDCLSVADSSTLPLVSAIRPRLSATMPPVTLLPPYVCFPRLRPSSPPSGLSFRLYALLYLDDTLP